MTLTLFALRIAFLVGLYGFLMILAWLVWREIKRGSSEALAGQAGGRQLGPALTVVESGNSGYPPGRQFPLRSVTTLGREMTNDIVITDAYASAHHARVEQRGDYFWLVDLESSNGTFLNGRKLRPTEPIPLDPGDVLRIGKVELKMG